MFVVMLLFCSIQAQNKPQTALKCILQEKPLMMTERKKMEMLLLWFCAFHVIHLGNMKWNLESIVTNITTLKIIRILEHVLAMKKKQRRFQGWKEICAMQWLPTFTKICYEMEKKHKFKNCASFQANFTFTVTQRVRSYTKSQTPPLMQTMAV